ncbi:MAG TPA: nucleoside deaminase [Candidatus Nitrosotenuis sp.]|jgi:tRNA(Arg) A34 adenosine deaminase TadA|nr:nucleoside deaminase [Candidatus Nitrosotenuis sp.]
MSMPSISFMDHAIACAEQASHREEIPVGAVIVLNNKIVSASGNNVFSQLDPTAHAEIVAIRQACQTLGQHRLDGCDIYVTLEPCALCAAAISLARIRTVYFGAYDPKGGAIEHGPRFFEQATCHHRPHVVGGIQEEHCSQLLKYFFGDKR